MGLNIFKKLIPHFMKVGGSLYLLQNANKPPAVYKKIKVLRWRIIEIFPKFAQKSPKKWTFWAKKVVVYLNFV